MSCAPFWSLWNGAEFGFQRFHYLAPTEVISLSHFGTSHPARQHARGRRIGVGVGG